MYLDEIYDEPIDDPEALTGEVGKRARIAAGIGRTCVVCGCSDSRPCPGGCTWAKPNLCSSCVGAAREAFP